MRNLVAEDTASSDSLFIRPSSPRVTWMMPPGAAYALTPSVSRTMNFQSSFGACWRGRAVPTRLDARHRSFW
jgi:hypothetical protein